MCLKALKILVSLSLCLCLLLPVATCGAYSITDQQMQRFEMALTGLKAELATLKENYKLSQNQLIEVEQRLKSADNLLKNSQIETQEALKALNAVKIELENLKHYCERLEQQNKIYKATSIGLVALLILSLFH